MFTLKILGKLRRKVDFKIGVIVAKCNFDTEPYDSFVEEEEAFLNVYRNLRKKKNFSDLKSTLKQSTFSICKNEIRVAFSVC